MAEAADLRAEAQRPRNFASIVTDRELLAGIQTMIEELEHRLVSLTMAQPTNLEFLFDYPILADRVKTPCRIPARRALRVESRHAAHHRP